MGTIDFLPGFHWFPGQNGPSKINYVTLIFIPQPTHYTEWVFYDCFRGFDMFPYGTVEAKFEFSKNFAKFLLSWIRLDL